MRLLVSEAVKPNSPFHLRWVDDEKNYEFFVAGSCPDALCGAKLKWDTLIPADLYGKERAYGYKYCRICADVAGIVMPVGDI